MLAVLPIEIMKDWWKQPQWLRRKYSKMYKNFKRTTCEKKVGGWGVIFVVESRNYTNKTSNWNPSCNLDCKENILS